MKFIKKMGFLLVISLFLNTLTVVYANEEDNKGNLDYLKNQDRVEILVKYKKNTDIKKKVKSKVKSEKIGTTNIELIEITGQDNVEETIAQLESNPEVEYIQPDFELHSNCDKKAKKVREPKFDEQWALVNKGQVINSQKGKSDIDIDILGAWEKTKGDETIVVGVLDNGVYLNHPDIRENIFTNKLEIPNNNIDDDGNKYIDDVNGYDFRNNTNKVYSTVYQDVYEESHGTFISGIICAQENQFGIVGVAPKIKVLPLKFMDGLKGKTSDAIRAIEYAKSMGVKIINCSFGGTNYNQALKEIMEENSEILFICSTGNNGNSVPFYPASFCLSNTISVTSIDNRGNLPRSANYGDTVEICAPGVDIISIIYNDEYCYMNGTSFAAPFVSGTAALLLSEHKKLKPKQIKDRIIKGVDKQKNLKESVSSKGIVNAKKALKK